MGRAGGCATGANSTSWRCSSFPPVAGSPQKILAWVGSGLRCGLGRPLDEAHDALPTAGPLGIGLDQLLQGSGDLGPRAPRFLLIPADLRLHATQSARHWWKWRGAAAAAGSPAAGRLAPLCKHRCRANSSIDSDFELLEHVAEESLRTRRGPIAIRRSRHARTSLPQKVPLDRQTRCFSRQDRKMRTADQPRTERSVRGPGSIRKGPSRFAARSWDRPPGPSEKA